MNTSDRPGAGALDGGSVKLLQAGDIVRGLLSGRLATFVKHDAGDEWGFYATRHDDGETINRPYHRFEFVSRPDHSPDAGNMVSPQPSPPIQGAVEREDWQVDYNAVVAVSAHLQKEGLLDSAKAVERMLSRAASYKNCRQAHVEKAALLSRIAVLEGALRPLAAWAASYDGDAVEYPAPDTLNLVIRIAEGRSRLCVGDLRAARSALQTQEG